MQPQSQLQSKTPYIKGALLGFIPLVCTGIGLLFILLHVSQMDFDQKFFSVLLIIFCGYVLQIIAICIYARFSFTHPKLSIGMFVGLLPAQLIILVGGTVITFEFLINSGSMYSSFNICGITGPCILGVTAAFIGPFLGLRKRRARLASIPSTLQGMQTE